MCKRKLGMICMQIGKICRCNPGSVGIMQVTIDSAATVIQRRLFSSNATATDRTLA